MFYPSIKSIPPHLTFHKDRDNIIMLDPKHSSSIALTIFYLVMQALKLHNSYDLIVPEIPFRLADQKPKANHFQSSQYCHWYCTIMYHFELT